MPDRFPEPDRDPAWGADVADRIGGRLRKARELITECERDGNLSAPLYAWLGFYVDDVKYLQAELDIEQTTERRQGRDA